MMASTVYETGISDGDLPISPESVVSITHEQNTINICSKTGSNGTTHAQTIICRQLFAGFRPMERNKTSME